MSAAEELIQDGVSAELQRQILDGQDMVGWDSEVPSPWLERPPANHPIRAWEFSGWILLGAFTVLASLAAMLARRH